MATLFSRIKMFKLRFGKKREEQSTGVYENKNTLYTAVIVDGLVFLSKEECRDQTDMLAKIRQKQNVYTVLKSSEVIYKNAIFPKGMKHKEIKEAVSYQFIDIEYEKYNISYRNTGFVVQNDISVLCIAVPLKDIGDFAQKHMNIYSGLELEPIALWRGFNKLHEGETERPKVIIGNSNHGIIVVCGRKNIEFVRFIPYDVNVNFEKIRTVDYYRRAFAAEDAEVKELTDDEYGYCIATGCALAPSDKEYVNLLPQHAKKVKKTEFKKPNMIELIIVCIVLLLLSFAVPKYFVHRYAKLVEEYEKKNAEVMPVCMEVDRIERELADIQQRFAVTSSFKAYSYMNIINDIRHALPKDMMLEKLDIVSQQEISQQPATSDAESNQKQTSQKQPSQQDQLLNEIDATARGGQQAQATPPPQAVPQSGSQANMPKTQVKQVIEYKPDKIYMSGKSASVKSIGFFVENLKQLPYIKNVTVDQSVTYDEGSTFYQFYITADIDIQKQI